MSTRFTRHQDRVHGPEAVRTVETIIRPSTQRVLLREAATVCTPAISLSPKTTASHHFDAKRIVP